jgi:hypothetical protein
MSDMPLVTCPTSSQLQVVVAVNADEAGVLHLPV